MKLTVRYGQATFKNRSSRVLSSSVDSEGNSTPVSAVLKQAGYLGGLMSNGEDEANGQFYGATYEYSEDGTLVILKHIQKFANTVAYSSILPLRLRTTGPLIIVKGVFPYMRGFAHPEDLMLFSGRADELTYDDLEVLGSTRFLSPYELTQGFDEEGQAACFDVRVTTRNLVGYQPRPEFVTVEHSDGGSTGVVLPKPHRRRVRVNTQAPDTPPPRKKRRRTT
jgi:hypothetical protein